VALAVVLAIPTLVPGLLADPVVASSKHYEEYRREKLVRFSQWSPVFRVDVMDHPFKLGNEFILFHDGQAGAGMVRFTPDFAHFKYLERDARLLPFRVLPPGPRVLIIGAAGGQEIAASLYFGASHVTAVELNPVSYSLLRNEFADITGRLAEHPKVTHINGDGRWFLKQSTEKYDLIWFPAPDSYAAMNASSAGAFVLSESYLYTVEMIRQALAHLTPRGIICTQFGEFSHDARPNRTTRYLATARAAFHDEGNTNFAQHALVASTEGIGALKESAILLGKDAFTPAEVARFTEQAHTSVNDGSVRYAPGMPANDSPITQAILVPDRHLERWHEHQPYAVHAIRDDAPFFWHFARFADAIEAPLPVDGKMIDPEDAIAEQVTLAFLFAATVFAACFLLVPLFTIRQVWKELPHKAAAFAYFAALGLGFMFLEIALIQKLTLLLGYPTYALSVTLCGLLVFSGLGSLLSSKYAAQHRRALYAVLGALCAIVIASQAALPHLIDTFVGSALPLRVALALLVLAPAGLCLGAFMPIGLQTVARATPHSREYVAWAWAVNGFFSVIASILATILAMIFGFRTLMLVALGIYVLGTLSFARMPLTRATTSSLR
jgi:spermidine synthase